MKTDCLLRITLTFFLLLLPPGMYAQDGEPEKNEAGIVMNVFTQTSMRTITVGTPWTIVFFVNHGVPDEVNVVMPSFAPSLFLDRIVKTPGMAGSNQTVIEYRFIPNSAGRFFIEPFTIITPHGIARTEREYFDVIGLSSEQRTMTPRIVWEGSPRQMAAGESAAISLRITGWDSNLIARGRIPPDFFMPEIPRGAIFLSLPLSAQEREGGLVIKFNLIPLETGDFILPARRLQYENVIFNIPSMNIRVTGYAGGTLTQSVTQSGERNNSPGGETFNADAARFPDFILDAFDKNISEARRKQCENIYYKAKDLWDNGLRAQALAELRRNERYHPAGALLRPIRLEAEKNLEFFNTGNEGREMQNALLILAFSFFILVIISLFVCFFIKRGMFLKRAALVCAVIFAVAGFFCLYRFADSGRLVRGNRFGVTNEVSVRRTPDYEGEELFRFREGQPVVVMLNSGAWVYVRANDADGKSGWLPAQEVIFY